MSRPAVSLQQVAEFVLLLFLMVSILWKGGKTLEATWLFGGVAILATATLALSSREWRAAPRVLLGSLLLSLLWGIVSYLTTTAGNYGLDELLRDASVTLLLLWVILRPERSAFSLEFRERFLLAVSVATLVACAFGVAVYALQPVSRFVGSFFDYRFHTDYWPNAWAEFLLLAWPLVLWTFRHARVWIRSLVVGFVLGCLYLSYSRGAFLAFTFQGAILGSFALLRLWQQRSADHPLPSEGRALAVRHAAFAIGAVCVSVIVFLSVNGLRGQLFEVQSVEQKVTFTAKEGRSSVDERRDFWRQAIALTRERPILGWGPYSFRFVQPRLQTGVFETSDHAHNVFLKLSAERGVPAALLFALVLLSVLLPALRWIGRPGSAEAGTFYLFEAFAAVAVVGVVVHNLIDYNLQFVGILLPWTLLLGLLARSRSPALVAPRFRVPLLVALSLLAALLGFVLVREGWFLAVSSLGRHAEASGDRREALRWYARARDEWFSRDLHLSRTQLLLALDQPSDALAAVDDALAVNAEDARAWILRGETLRRLRLREEAAASYRTAFQYGRYNYIAATRGLLQTLSDLGDDASLGQEQPEVDQIVAAFQDAFRRNAHFIALSGNVEDFIAFLQFLERLYPADAARYRAIQAPVWQHAVQERLQLSSRKTGYLW